MNILIGDDHALFREGVLELLKQLYPDAAYHQVSTFHDVLEQCRSEDPLDLILTDLQMPGWPGFAGIRQLRDMRPDTPLVVVSASETRADVRAALESGASGYIPKSSSVKIMLSALSLVQAGGVYVPPAAMAEAAASSTMPSFGESEGDEVHHPLHNGRGRDQLLTQRQLDVLNCLRQGKSNKQIAYELGLSEGTVKIHVTAIFKSLGVKNRTQAVISASKMAV